MTAEVRTSTSVNGLPDDVTLSVRDLVKTFHVGGGLFGGQRGEVSAVAGISVDSKVGSTIGLVGDLGCGKSATAQCVLRLIEPTSGEIVLQRRTEDGTTESGDDEYPVGTVLGYVVTDWP